MARACASMEESLRRLCREDAELAGWLAVDGCEVTAAAFAAPARGQKRQQVAQARGVGLAAFGGVEEGDGRMEADVVSAAGAGAASTRDAVGFEDMVQQRRLSSAVACGEDAGRAPFTLPWEGCEVGNLCVEWQQASEWQG